MLVTSWELWIERTEYFVMIDLLARRPSHVVSQDDIVTRSTGYKIMSVTNERNTAKMNLLPIIPLCDCR